MADKKDEKPARVSSESAPVKNTSKLSAVKNPDPMKQDKTSQLKSVHSSTQKSASLGNNSKIGPLKNTAGTVAFENAGEKQSKQNIRRFFHMLKEKTGMVDKTDYPKQLQEAFDRIDEYKLVLDTVAEAVCGCVQQNPSKRIVGDPQMKLDSPPGEDEYELVAAWLKQNKNEFSNYKNSENIAEGFAKMGSLHREYQLKSRKALHNIRTFLKHDYWVIGNHRRDLEQNRISMDFNKAQLKGAKDPEMIEQRSKLSDEATKVYENKLREVTTMVGDLTKHMDSHVADIKEWSKAEVAYHEKVVQLLTTLDMKQ